MFGRLIIDTGKDEQQLINANPISRGSAVKITGFTSDQRAEEIQLSDG